MPVIPGANESQVLNAGSPVPVASSEGARAIGEAEARLGQQLFALGDALDTAAKQAKSRQNKLDLESALGDFELRMRERRIMVERAAPGKELEDNINSFRDGALNDVNAIADLIGNAEVRQEFIAKAKQKTAGELVPVQAEEIIKFDGLASTKWQLIGAQKEALAFSDPTTVDKSLVDIQEVLFSSGARPDKVAEAVRKGSYSIVDSAVRGAINRGDYKGAKTLAEKYAGFYEKDQRQVTIDKIESTKWENLSHTHTMNEWEHTRKERELENDREAYAVDTLNLIANAESEQARNVILRDRRIKGFEAGLMTKDWDAYVTKVSSEAYTGVEDDLFGVKILAQLSEGSITIARAKKLTIMATSGGNDMWQEAIISPQAGKSLLMYLRDAERQLKNDPMYLKQVNEALAYGKTYGVSDEGTVAKIIQNFAPSGVERDRAQRFSMGFLSDLIRDPGDVQGARDRNIRKVFPSDTRIPVIDKLQYRTDDPDDVITKKAADAAKSLPPQQRKIMRDQTKEFIRLRKIKEANEATRNKIEEDYNKSQPKQEYK